MYATAAKVSTSELTKYGLLWPWPGSAASSWEVVSVQSSIT